jgi:hypothetical protein
MRESHDNGMSARPAPPGRDACAPAQPAASDLIFEATAPLPLSGERVGRYVFIRELGRGGVGVV